LKRKFIGIADTKFDEITDAREEEEEFRKTF